MKLNTLCDMLVVLYGKQSKKRKKISKKGQSITKITFLCNYYYLDSIKLFKNLDYCVHQTRMLTFLQQLRLLFQTFKIFVFLKLFVD